LCNIGEWDEEDVKGIIMGSKTRMERILIKGNAEVKGHIILQSENERELVIKEMRLLRLCGKSTAHTEDLAGSRNLAILFSNNIWVPTSMVTCLGQ
jgi:hypothetical protein